MIAWLNLQAAGGVLCIAVGLYVTWLGLDKLRRWPRVQGQVINVVRLGGVPTPEIEFTAADGVPRKFFAKLPYRQRLKVGSPVKVLYNPAAPDEVERVSLMGSIFAPLMFVVFGASQLFCGFWSCR
jgi:hypothetical protein